MIVNPTLADTLRLRHHIEKFLQEFLEDQEFTRVHTPLLTAGAGGAVARPFATVATEFPDTHLTLRIAPELWLKRLVIGNLGRVYEIGPAFRNEGMLAQSLVEGLDKYLMIGVGVDLTHNPEFTICEFYCPYATLSDLISMTETLFLQLAARVEQLKSTTLKSLAPTPVAFTQTSFRQLPFIPTLESAIRKSGNPELVSYSLPKLESVAARDDVLELFNMLRLPVPETITLPHLLDVLCAEFIEPQCNKPTFITEHPECLSPLSKSFLDHKTGQKVAARVELFIQGREYVNAYEEENSPFEQRHKFMMQRSYRGGAGADEEGVGIDESYLEALEWGLPPTGGFGCGIDRLVMLFSGATRIADVLSFGTLRNVVALGQTGRKGIEKS